MINSICNVGRLIVSLLSIAAKVETMILMNYCKPGRANSFLLLLLLSLTTISGRTLAQNPVLPGDHPDPTVVRIGNTYWTASTSGDWAPEFPLYYSHDLRHWTAAGAVFPQTPEWASGSFWAPEMVSDRGRVLVYYVGRKRGGPLCVAVATATLAQGPYIDHGPILCQPDGSIDPSFVRDERGQPFLIWKEDGNSEGKATPIWAQPLTSDLLHITGTKVQLIVNDPASWEGRVVEGPYILRHARRFYLFYAGNACCGSACNYAEGVARAGRLFGPWEKDPANPIIRSNAAWKCPGHGTAVETLSGKDYFLYHAYPAVGTVYLGRESVLDAVDWGSDGWPTFNSGHGPSGGLLPGDAAAAQKPFVDDFQSLTLDPEWKWPIGRAPIFHVGDGRLVLEASADEGPVCLGRSLMASAYVATVGVDTRGGAEGGLGLIGNAESRLVLSAHGKHLELFRVTSKAREALWQTELGSAAVVWLRVSSAGNAEVTFSYSLDRKQWIMAKTAISLAGLPPWDQGLRVGLVSNGTKGTRVSFVRFSLDAKN
jgi:xylan 1,4-beta-xylosidase